MKIYNGKLFWNYHELAWSARTSGVIQYFFDEQGNIVGQFYSEKQAGFVTIPSNAKYFLRRYWTNSGYPDHILYIIEDNQLKRIFTVSRSTSPLDVVQANIPNGIKNFLLKDVWGENL